MSTAVEQILDTVRTLTQTEREDLIAALQDLKTNAPGISQSTLVQEIRGKYRHVPTSVEAFLKRKSAETDKESRS